MFYLWHHNGSLGVLKLVFVNRVTISNVIRLKQLLTQPALWVAYKWVLNFPCVWLIHQSEFERWDSLSWFWGPLRFVDCSLTFGGSQIERLPLHLWWPCTAIDRAEYSKLQQLFATYDIHSRFSFLRKIPLRTILLLFWTQIPLTDINFATYVYFIPTQMYMNCCMFTYMYEQRINQIWILDMFGWFHM